MKLLANKNKNFTHLYGGGGGYEGPVCRKKGGNNVMKMAFFSFFHFTAAVVLTGSFWHWKKDKDDFGKKKLANLGKHSNTIFKNGVY